MNKRSVLVVVTKNKEGEYFAYVPHLFVVRLW